MQMQIWIFVEYFDHDMRPNYFFRSDQKFSRC
jgi:hypothetical protein